MVYLGLWLRLKQKQIVMLASVLRCARSLYPVHANVSVGTGIDDPPAYVCLAFVQPSRFPGEEELVAEVHLVLNIDLPGWLSSIPGFSESGDEALSQMVSALERGAKQRAQTAYNEYVQRRESSSVA